MAETPQEMLLAEGEAADGRVQVDIRAGRVERVFIDPHWRAASQERAVVDAVRDATNAALQQYREQLSHQFAQADPVPNAGDSVRALIAEVEKVR